jgi:hypothetical protein
MSDTTIDVLNIKIMALTDSVKDLKDEMRIMDAHLSKQISQEVTNTFWKILPITVTVQLAMSSLIAACMFFIARAM